LLLYVYSLEYARIRLSNDIKNTNAGVGRQSTSIIHVYKTIASVPCNLHTLDRDLRSRCGEAAVEFVETSFGNREIGISMSCYCECFGARRDSYCIFDVVTASSKGFCLLVL
jgi:hypothetical protein